MAEKFSQAGGDFRLGDVLHPAGQGIGFAGGEVELLDEEDFPQAAVAQDHLHSLLAGGSERDALIRLVADQPFFVQLADHLVG